MLKYEDYLNKCFLLGNSQNSTDFIRSVFDYGIRQRRALKGYSTHNFTLTVNLDQLRAFQRLWHDLGEGTDPFLTDKVIHGNINKDKTIRFTSGYSLEEVGYYTWRIKAQVELMAMGIDPATVCPLVPHYGLTIGSPLVPC